MRKIKSAQLSNIEMRTDQNIYIKQKQYSESEIFVFTLILTMRKTPWIQFFINKTFCQSITCNHIIVSNENSKLETAPLKL